MVGAIEQSGNGADARSDDAGGCKADDGAAAQ